jgi:hypothetical protein
MPRKRDRRKGDSRLEFNDRGQADMPFA